MTSEQVTSNTHIVWEPHMNATTTTTTTAAIETASTRTVQLLTAPKEKRRWFNSLTKGKKSQSQTSLVNPCFINSNEPLQNNNNNNNDDPLPIAATLMVAAGVARKRKEEQNVFQRFRKKMGIRFRNLRRGQFDAEDEDLNGTTDASAEFLTHSPARKAQLNFRFMQSNNRLEDSVIEEPEIVPFTHDYIRFIVKKWLENESEPNRIMYKACCEMLSQVWYWGEISRRDAQKQLTDKPTGSFLVRDSESSGCQFTLSFRIVNVTLHYRLEYRDNYWHFEELQYESIVEMIEDILFRCTNDNFVCFVKVPNEIQPPFPVILKYPLSRYLKMPHLQDLCRRVIQRHAAQHEIAKLPIPPKLLEYLSDTRELVFQC